MPRSRAAVGEFSSSDEPQPGRTTSASTNSPATARDPRLLPFRIASPGGENSGGLSSSLPFGTKSGECRMDFEGGGWILSRQEQREERITAPDREQQKRHFPAGPQVRADPVECPHSST